MKVVVRNPTLPVLVGWILLGFSVRKSTRLRKWRAETEIDPLVEDQFDARFLERLRNARGLTETRTERQWG